MIGFPFEHIGDTCVGLEINTLCHIVIEWDANDQRIFVSADGATKLVVYVTFVTAGNKLLRCGPNTRRTILGECPNCTSLRCIKCFALITAMLIGTNKHVVFVLNCDGESKVIIDITGRCD
ncbi:hypothetical protein D3C87_835260 [compost metagenome]